YILKKSKYLRSNSARIVRSYKKILINYLKLNWHTTIFYAYNGQVSIFLIGVFVCTSNLADLGALTRFSMLFIVLNALVTTLLSPAFGRESKKSKLKIIYFKTCIGLAAISATILAIVYFIPEPFLWILGPQYKDLSFELLL